MLSGTVRMTSQISPHEVFAKCGRPQTSSTAARPMPMTACTTCLVRGLTRPPSKISVRTRPTRRQGRVAEPLPSRTRDRRAVGGCAGRPPGCGRRSAPPSPADAAPPPVACEAWARIAARLARGVPAHVDAVGDVGAGREGPLERRGVELLGEPVDAPDRPQRPHDACRAAPSPRAPAGSRRARRPAPRPRAPGRGRGGRTRRSRRRRAARRRAPCAAAPPAARRPRRPGPGRTGWRRAGRARARARCRCRRSRATRPARRRGRRPSAAPPRSRRSPRPPSRRISAAASPAPPSVASTRTTRWPAAAARAIVPAVSSASSSGWAWNATIVGDIGAHPPAWQAGALVKVAMLTDCYPPRLGGIESQVRDLSAPARARRARGRGVHGDDRPGRRARRCADHRRRRRHGAPARDPAAGRHPGQPVRARGGAPPPRRRRLRRRARAPRAS